MSQLLSILSYVKIISRKKCDHNYISENLVSKEIQVEKSHYSILNNNVECLFYQSIVIWERETWNKNQEFGSVNQFVVFKWLTMRFFKNINCIYVFMCVFVCVLTHMSQCAWGNKSTACGNWLCTTVWVLCIKVR